MPTFIHDDDRSAAATDEQGREYILTVGIDEDGDEAFYVWVPDEYARVETDEQGREQYMFASCPCDAPAHEQLGPLPTAIADRVAGLCGHVGSTTGRPCRNPADRCQWHRDRARST